MTQFIETQNQGPLITRSTYWFSDMAHAGCYYLSPNSGCFRLLVPADRSADLAEMRTAKEVVLSFGFHRIHAREMIEILFDDRTAKPFALYLSREQIERLPAAHDYGRGFEFTVWESRRGVPHKVLSRPCWLQRAPLPCLRRITSSP